MFFFYAFNILYYKFNLHSKLGKALVTNKHEFANGVLNQFLTRTLNFETKFLRILIKICQKDFFFNNFRLRNVYCVAADFTNIHVTDTKNTQT